MEMLLGVVGGGGGCEARFKGILGRRMKVEEAEEAEEKVAESSSLIPR